MKGMIISFDFLFSAFVFMALILFLGTIWNTNVQELGKEENQLLYLRTQQTLNHIFNQVRRGHKIYQTNLTNFINEANFNYTSVKNEFGLEDADFKFLVKNLQGQVLQETNATPAGSIILKSTRYGMLDEPVSIEVWVWK